MNIRKATANDIEQIVNLNRLLNGQHVLLDPIWVGGEAVDDFFRKHLTTEVENPLALNLVAEDNGSLVGWFAGRIEETPTHFRERKIGHISSAYVLPEYRRQGVTKAGMEMMFKWFKENGVNLAELSVASENKEGLAAWEGLGFVEYKKRMKREI